jgi:hypothetical protein
MAVAELVAGLAQLPFELPGRGRVDEPAVPVEERVDEFVDGRDPGDGRLFVAEPDGGLLGGRIDGFLVRVVEGFSPRRIAAAGSFAARTTSGKSAGAGTYCRECDRKRSKAYYQANRGRILEKAAARRGPASAGPPLFGVRGGARGPSAVVCSERCREARFKRLHPESYARREAAKVERRRERRRELRGREPLTGGVVRRSLPKNRCITPATVAETVE